MVSAIYRGWGFDVVVFGGFYCVCYFVLVCVAFIVLAIISWYYEHLGMRRLVYWFFFNGGRSAFWGCGGDISAGLVRSVLQHFGVIESKSVLRFRGIWVHDLNDEGRERERARQEIDDIMNRYVREKQNTRNANIKKTPQNKTLKKR